MAFPKKIFTYWHQGFDNAPEVVSVCVRQMQRINPRWRLIQLDQWNLKNQMPPLSISDSVAKKMTLAARSDLIRLQLLISHGGVWMDPTVYCHVPLDDWLEEKLRAGIFMFQNPGRDRLVSSWFIAAEKAHPLLLSVKKQLDAYWCEANFRNLERKPTRLEGQIFRFVNRHKEWTRLWFKPIFTRIFPLQPYFFFHYSIYDQIRSNKELGSLWQTVPAVDAERSMWLSRFGLSNIVDEKVLAFISRPDAYVSKLSWKEEDLESSTNTVLRHLVENSTLSAQLSKS